MSVAVPMWRSVGAITAWGAWRTGPPVVQGLVAIVHLKDNLHCYCVKTFETAKGKREKWCNWEPPTAYSLSFPFYSVLSHLWWDKWSLTVVELSRIVSTITAWGVQWTEPNIWSENWLSNQRQSVTICPRPSKLQRERKFTILNSTTTVHTVYTAINCYLLHYHVSSCNAHKLKCTVCHILQCSCFLASAHKACLMFKYWLMSTHVAQSTHLGTQFPLELRSS